LAEDDGDALERYAYDPYGNVTVLDGGKKEIEPDTWVYFDADGEVTEWDEDTGGSDWANTILFAGSYRDSATLLYHVRNRMYHVKLGLWLIRDPQGYVDGMSLYEYCGGSALGRCDPKGLTWELFGRLHRSNEYRPELIDDLAYADAEYNLVTRGTGALQAAGGLVEGAIGCAITLGSKGILGCLGGYQMWAHGSDVMGAGLRKVWTGEEIGTCTKQMFEEAGQRAGLAPQEAESLAGAADATLSIMNMGVGATTTTPETIQRASQTLAGAGNKIKQGILAGRGAISGAGPAGNGGPAPATSVSANAPNKAAGQTVGELRAAGSKDAHHVIQDAAVRDLPGYNTNSAPGVRLPGSSTTKGTPHYNATQVQRQFGGGTYGAERRIAYKALRRAGLSEAAAHRTIQEADAYFRSIGVDPTTPTRVPGNRSW
jgi:RHS repeat-associated protein